MAKKSQNKNKTKTKTTKDTREEIAIKGKKTSGTNIGDAREIKASEVGPAREIEASKINDIERVEGYKLGDAELVSGIDVDASKQAEFRDLQMGLAKQLEAQTRGEGPSLAALQLKEATQQNIKEQLGIAASGQGVNSALAQRTAQYNIADLGQKSALQSAQVRMAEQLNAQSQLAGLTNQGRMSDINLAQSQAEVQLQQALANQAEKNKFQLAQGEFSQQANIANQSAYNTWAANQAALAQQANIANQGAFNTNAEQQAALNQQAAIANQGAFNSAQQAQADINAKIRQSQISAGATTAAAAAGAGAANRATDASLYKFNQELAFEMDKYYQGQGRGDASSNYNTSAQGAVNNYNLTNDQFDAVGNFGGALAQQQAQNLGKRSRTSQAIYR